MYYLRITDYAEELLDVASSNNLPGWPERVRVMQANWIGKSDGVRFAFPHDIAGADGEPIGDGQLYVFTTRADTIMGVTFAPWRRSIRWPRMPRAADPQLAAFIEQCKTGGAIEADMATMEKEGHADRPLRHAIR